MQYYFSISFNSSSNRILNAESIADSETPRMTPDFENMKSISLEEYSRLCQASIELIKANRTINKLNITIQKKNDIIENLNAKLAKRTEYPHLSPVSELGFIEKYILMLK